MKFQQLMRIYLVVLLIECFANAFKIFPIQIVTKPSLMLLLLYYFTNQSKNLSYLKGFIFGALLFSWLGDVILLFEKKFPFLFIFGLISFLIAHIFYVVYFWKVGKRNFSKYQLKPFILLVVTIYSGSFYLLIFPYLSFLKIPVLIYCLVISLMLIASFHAFDFAKQNFGKICVLGTILFAISDSILAINRFVFPIFLGSVLVMLTYSIGQFLIMEGALRNLREIEFE